VAKRLTSLATVLALSGSPAAFAACMAACLHGVPAAAMAHEPGVAVEHAEHASSPQPVSVSEHAHHESPAAPASAASAGHQTSSTARLSAGCGDCCPDAQATVVVAASGAGRASAFASGAAPALTPVTSFLVMTSVPGAAPPGPPVPPPSPTRALLVLRI